MDAADIADKAMFFVPSFSHRTLVYKWMLIAPQLPAYFSDIVDGRVESALAMVHSRFSTNTFPNWARAHPYRYVCHNGEINTLRGNINWMHARESLFSSPLFGDDLQKLLPIIDQRGQRLRDVRQRAGDAHPHRARAPPRRDDDDPGAVERPHESMSAKREGVLRVPRLAHGARDGRPPSPSRRHRIGAPFDRNGLASPPATT